MLSTNLKKLVLGASVTAALTASSPVAFGQASTPVDKVSGAQLQKWLDEGFSYAGVHRTSQCVILNVAQGSARTLFIRCPNGWAEKIPGSARVNGDAYCTSFPIPNTPPGEDCVTWHPVGQGKYEQRKAGELDTTVLLLPQGLVAPR